MINVVDDSSKWVVTRGNETITVYKNRNIAIYGINGKPKIVGYGNGLRHYFNADITDDVFDKMVEYIHRNVVLR